jgi:hypothetical protein
MKAFKWVVCTVFFILAVVVVYTMVLKKPSKKMIEPYTITLPQADTNIAQADIESGIMGCYATYIDAFQKTATAVVNDGQTEAIKKCFTSHFISTWNTLAEKSGTDPVLFSQDIQTSWATNITAHITQASKNSAEAKVILGTSNNQQKLIVHLTVERGMWLIGSVSPL